MPTVDPWLLDKEWLAKIEAVKTSVNPRVIAMSNPSSPTKMSDIFKASRTPVSSPTIWVDELRDVEKAFGSIGTTFSTVATSFADVSKAMKSLGSLSAESPWHADGLPTKLDLKQNTMDTKIRWAVAQPWHDNVEVTVSGYWAVHPTQDNADDNPEGFLYVGRTSGNGVVKIDRAGGALQLSFDRDVRRRTSTIDIGIRFCVPFGADPTWVNSLEARDALGCLDQLITQPIKDLCGKALTELYNWMPVKSRKIAERQLIDTIKSAGNRVLNQTCPVTDSPSKAKLYQLWTEKGKDLSAAGYSKSALTDAPPARDLLPNEGTW